MLFRRVLEHVRSQNWFAVAVDFLIVVTGVALGLQAQEWYQQSKDREKERTYLVQLSSDFAGIERAIGQCLAVYRESLKAIEYISRTIDAGTTPVKAQEGGRDAFSEALLKLTAGTTPAGRSAAFVEIISSGKLNVLRDRRLRNALIAYDQRAQRDWEIWRVTRSETSGYYRALYENVEVSIDPGKRNFSSVRDYDFDALASSANFNTMLNVVAGGKANTHALCKGQLVLAEQVRTLIKNNPAFGGRRD
ncbi:MAG: hypothetical protein ACLFWF_11810 [Alphaproteobacteria bacterium]